MSQSFGHILLVLAVIRQSEGGLVFRIIIIEHRQNGVFLGNAFVAIVDVIVEHILYIQRRLLLLDYLPIDNGLEHCLRRQNAM